MRIKRHVPGLMVLLAVVTVAPVLQGDDDNRGNRRIVLLDACDPDDPGWAPTGGCHLEKGDVSVAEFNAFLRSPLYDLDPDPTILLSFLVGHPAWRNEPSHLAVEEFKKIRVKNAGGRTHTLTPVAAFGGGRVAPLRVGTIMAPECAPPPGGAIDPWLVAPGARLQLTAPEFDPENAENNIHRLQCCLHPWMRATVRVTEGNEHDQ